MSSAKISKIYKFKIANIRFTVNIDTWKTAHGPGDPVAKVEKLKTQHFHAAYELFLIGDTPLSVHSAAGIKEYTNSIVCIPPFYKHYSIGRGSSRLLFTFENTDGAHNPFSDFMEEFFSKTAPFEAPMTDSIRFYREEFIKFFSNGDKISDDVGASVLKLIFHNVYESNSQSKNQSALSTNESYLIKLDSLINDFENDINLQNVSEALCLSTKQASRVIKKHYKKNLSDLLTERRLEVAAYLLSETDKSISEIVENVNFSSESYFYLQFKKAYGCTPAEYKKQHKNTDQ